MRCQCCEKESASVQMRDVEQWETREVTAVCESCAQLLMRHMLNPHEPLPSSAGAIEAVRGQLEKAGVELGAKSTKPKTEGIAVEEKPAKLAPCPACGMTFAEFQKSGRLGCPECYEAFLPRLEPVLERIHGDGALAHKGRKPSQPAPDSRALTRQRIQTLKREMQAAVKEENYEKAAELRDRIAALEAEMSA